MHDEINKVLEEDISAQDEMQDESHKREQELEAEVASLKEKVLRIMADMENTRKRAQREKEDMAKYAVSNFAQDILVVSDNLRRALLSIPAEEIDGNPQLKNIVEGVIMTEKELINGFKKHGVEEVPALGEKFDHNLHQAMFETEKEGVAPGIVVEVMQAGYKINDRLLRPAMVGVSK